MNLNLNLKRLSLQTEVIITERKRVARSDINNPEGAGVRILDFSKTTTLGNWRADILVRSRRSVNPEADRNVQCHQALTF